VSDNRNLQSEEIPAPTALGSDVIISPDTLAHNRLPPRQVRTRKFYEPRNFELPFVQVDCGCAEGIKHHERSP
jgi:hypothetical protein